MIRNNISLDFGGNPGSVAASLQGASSRSGGDQVLALPSPCRRVIMEHRKTLLNRSWHACDTCSIKVELTLRIVTAPCALIEAVRFAPRT
jgi:hypothetical protein